MVEKIKQSIWKYATLFLLALMLGVSLIVFLRITTTREVSLENKVAQAEKNFDIATVQTDKAKLNTLINHILKEFQSKNSSYSFYIDKEAVFEGEYNFLGSKVPIYIYFTPSANKDGNINLKVKTISAGTLSIPTATVMSFIQGANEFPEYVELNAKKEIVTIRLDKVELPNNLAVKAKLIDVVNDKFVFDCVMGE
ncbi:Uncharacterized protein YpmS [Pilibacter termitis]|uniref:Uncharacterized protein YpmS n=1 Tax=Pilibacter termitis TaxID=263852 RepID=A0A1T4NYF5_9ENTE|nr:YpmS family protein [Pilibacter termitis]SJZ84251.1 Uncharacterized protein YpmS [Pilibacter termitis]